MKIEEIKKSITNHAPELYSFAYILIPDDLQASQLLIDAVQSYLLMRSPEAKHENTKRDLLKIIFDISRKRYQQLKLSFLELEKFGGFYSLEFDEKSVLYLKEKFQLDIESIEYITSMNQAEVLAVIYSAKIKLIEKGGTHPVYEGTVSE